MFYMFKKRGREGTNTKYNRMHIITCIKILSNLKKLCSSERKNLVSNFLFLLTLLLLNTEKQLKLNSTD